jgi:hypothetical protein
MTVALGGGENPAPREHPARAIIDGLNRSDRWDRKLMKGEDTFRRSFIIKSFNRDAIIAADMDASFSITPLFVPMIKRHGISLDRPGDHALSILVPNLGRLPWEAVAEFREHPGSSEARAKLREFEDRATGDEPQSAYEFLENVAQEVSSSYRAAIKELAPKLPESLALEAVKTFVSVSSVIGPVLEKGASVVHDAVEARRFNRSWIASLMRLQEE